MMSLSDAKKEIDRLSKELKQHNYNYYALAQPTITDQEFPQFAHPDSPTRRVGGEITKPFRTVRHRYPMLSLGNTYSEQDLLDFDKRIKKLIGDNFQYVCELKFDGVAIGITYRDGKL